jgi:hypothetical protein
MEIEQQGGVTNRLQITLTKDCPHCRKPTQHKTEVRIPVTLNPSYKIFCPACGRVIWVTWRSVEGDITASFDKAS